jgi:Polyketide cyclase / dehydrase and lipid transport
MNTAPDTIRWPAEFNPSRAPIHAVNRLDMQASPEAVWKVLIRAVEWPQFYANSAKVKIAGGAKDLSAGARFTWRTFGVSLVSRVEEFVPNERIGWTAKGTGVWVYHAWLITPLAGGGCHVLTEETQYGFLSRLGKILYPGRMEREHQNWLEALAVRAGA